MLKIRFLQPLSIPTIETILVDGIIEIKEYNTDVSIGTTLLISSIIPTDNISIIDIEISTDTSIKMLKHISLPNLSFLQGEIPNFLKTEHVDLPPPASPCGCGKK